MAKRKPKVPDHRLTDMSSVIHRPNGKPLQRVNANNTSLADKGRPVYEVMKSVTVKQLRKMVNP